MRFASRVLPLSVGPVLLLAGAYHAASSVSAQTLPVDPAARGRELAAEVCSGCHIIDQKQAGVASDGVPTFMSIAARLDKESIETTLLSPAHPVMPEPPLDHRQRSDVLAYIRSLAPDG
jgi:mono/diheme cytochrome c family protein